MSEARRTTPTRTAILLLAAVGTIVLSSNVGAQTSGGEQGLGPLDVRRESQVITARACLRGFADRGRALEEVESALSVYADGRLVQTTADAIRFALPLADGTSDPADPCTGTTHGVGLAVPVASITASGVDLPDPGDWTSFELTTVLQFEGRTFEASRTVDLGAGDAVGALTSATPTSEGVRLGGWIVDPETAHPVRYRVTVDGVDFPRRLPTAPTEPAGALAEHLANGPGPAVWDDRELGGAHSIHAVVPYGTICVHALLDAEEPVSTGYTTIGCLSTPSGAVSATFDQVTPSTGAVRLRGSYVNPWIGPDEEFPGPVLVPDKGRPMMILSASRRGNPPEPYGEITGWFDFDVRMELPPGRRTVCVRDASWSGPRWEPGLGSERGTLACTDVQVPHRPEGAAEVLVDGREITVRGWAVDLNGGRPRVLVVAGGAVRGLTRTNERNDEIRRLIGGDGYSGYTVRFRLPPGKHRVCTAWEDTSGGGWSQPSCSDIVVK